MTDQHPSHRTRTCTVIVLALAVFAAVRLHHHYHPRYLQRHLLVYHLKNGRFVCHKPAGVSSTTGSDDWFVLTNSDSVAGDYRSSSRLGGTLPRGTGWTASRLSRTEIEEAQEDEAESTGGKESPAAEEETVCVDNETGQPAADNDAAESDSSASDSSSDSGGGDAGGDGGGDGGGD